MRKVTAAFWAKGGDISGDFVPAMQAQYLRGGMDNEVIFADKAMRGVNQVV
jgi:hypothetical protein